MGGPQESDVAAWINAVEQDLARLGSELVPLLERQSALTERLGLLKRLLTSISVPAAGDAPTKSPVIQGGGTARTTMSVHERVQADAIAILSGAATPMHINDIHAEFIRRGLEVPGAGKPNNITVHLSDAPGIRSTARGFYTLDDATTESSTMRYPVIDQSRGRRTHG